MIDTTDQRQPSSEQVEHAGIAHDEGTWWSPISAWAGLLGVLVTLSVATVHTHPAVLAAWALAIVALSALRASALIHQWRPAARPEVQLGLRHKLEYGQLALCGAHWAAMLLWLGPKLDATEQMLLTCVELQACATVVIFAAPGAFVFLGLVNISLAWTWLVWGQGPYAPLMAALPPLLLLLYGLAYRRQRRNLERHLRLRDEAQCLAQDLTERYQQLSEVSQSKSRLLAEASHDLRQPVHAIGMLIAGFDLSRDKRDLMERLRHLKSRVELLEDMLQSMLDMSRFDLGLYIPNQSRFALSDFLLEVTRVASENAQRKGLYVHLRQSFSNDAVLFTDKGLLSRMVFNLLHNAVKFTQRGGIDVHARFDADAQDDEIGLQLSVIDSGVGIDPAHLPHIFQCFVGSPHQAESPNSLGVGLAVVERGARALGLSVGVKSQPGQGSAFTLNFPARLLQPFPAAVPLPPDAAGALRSATAPYTPQPSVSEWDEHMPVNVILIDDDQVALDSTAELIGSWGYAVRTAVDLEHAMRLLTQDGFRPDVVISDYQLRAAQNGIDCIDAIRVYIGSPRLTALMLTGALTLELRHEADARGIEVFHKPLRPSALRQALSKAVLHPLHVSATST